MRRIGIFGSYGGASIGDEAILKGLLRTLEETYGNNIEVVIFTLNEKVTRSALKGNYQFNVEYREIKGSNDNFVNQKNSITEKQQLNIKMYLYKKLSELSPTLAIYIEQLLRKVLRKPLLRKKLSDGIDTLIFGGGNILMDLYYRWPLIMNLLIKEFSKQNTKILFLGVGAGPIQTRYGKKVIKNIVKDYYVSTRDEESSELLNKMGKGKSVVGNDLAFGLYRKIDHLSKCGIGVSVIPFHAKYYWPKAEQKKYRNYKLNIARILDRLIEDTGENIEFFATNHPSDIAAANDIVKEMHNLGRVSVNNNKMNVDELLYFISKKNFIIGTRLHSLILSTCVQTNFYAVNYQPKVNYFLNGIALGEKYVDIQTICQKELKDMEISRISNQIRSSYALKENADLIVREKKEGLKNEMLRVVE